MRTRSSNAILLFIGTLVVLTSIMSCTKSKELVKVLPPTNNNTSMIAVQLPSYSFQSDYYSLSARLPMTFIMPDDSLGIHPFVTSIDSVACLDSFQPDLTHKFKWRLDSVSRKISLENAVCTNLILLDQSWNSRFITSSNFTKQNTRFKGLNNYFMSLKTYDSVAIYGCAKNNDNIPEGYKLYANTHATLEEKRLAINTASTEYGGDGNGVEAIYNMLKNGECDQYPANKTQITLITYSNYDLDKEKTDYIIQQSKQRGININVVEMNQDTVARLLSLGPIANFTGGFLATISDKEFYGFGKSLHNLTQRNYTYFDLYFTCYQNEGGINLNGSYDENKFFYFDCYFFRDTSDHYDGYKRYLKTELYYYY